MNEKINRALISTLRPGWTTNDNYNKIATDNFHKIFEFYVLNTICDNLSCKGRNVKESWGKDVWKKGVLRSALLSSFTGGEGDDEHILFSKTYQAFGAALNQLNLNGDFHKQREEKIVVYQKKKLTQIENIFNHIRNSFAHGRFNIYKKDAEFYYVFEDVRIYKCQGECVLQARMILKETTLLKWIDIVSNPNKAKNHQIKMANKPQNKKPSSKSKNV